MRRTAGSNNRIRLPIGCTGLNASNHLFRDDYSRDTSGENNYHHTSSFDDDILMDIDRGGASARLDRTQDDLHKFRQRIDNNVEQQREYSEMMHALQNKVFCLVAVTTCQ